jgi:hypothetical protein
MPRGIPIFKRLMAPMFQRLFRFWRKRQRDVDRRILFPAFMDGSKGDTHLAVAIMMHVLIDPAWRLPDEWREEEPEIFNLMKSVATGRENSNG